MPGYDGYLVHPVDHPEVSSDTIRALMAAFGNAAVKPRYRSRAGHPVIIPSSLAAMIEGTDVNGGLAAVIRSSGTPITLVDVEDPGVIRNINTKEDLAHGR
jgi:molybdenum cofactor cytidylyltransferase